MKRLYYFTKSLASIQGITGELRQAGIGENRLHVMGTDTMAIAQAHVHGTTPWEETDIMHSGFLGALIGMAAGLFGGFLLAGLDPWGANLESGAIIGATLFGTCFGAWLGGLRGVSSTNHHLSPYIDRVEQGDYLMMVDADDDLQATKVEKVMHGHRHEAEEAGREEHFSPFD
ncbi:hypothetical protein A3754_11575 [Alcanivorax sp. HI0083]|uniref:hypothetical protein n=1 Tax=unclassified Alcanivorax TaxID=2638842 RepID=UPI0007B8B52B|nr:MULTISPECIES: hypothetical protein [unclassified Alcanivorax]KZY33713.1 hypothetical protein A3730_03710 [Alcanivorax sp. HI0044]KZZ26331.1 hypothetical protein A3754_11575 [Alcanivorax sp. HI0083]